MRCRPWPRFPHSPGLCPPCPAPRGRQPLSPVSALPAAGQPGAQDRAVRKPQLHRQEDRNHRRRCAQLPRTRLPGEGLLRAGAERNVSPGGAGGGSRAVPEHPRGWALPGDVCCMTSHPRLASAGGWDTSTLATGATSTCLKRGTTRTAQTSALSTPRSSRSGASGTCSGTSAVPTTPPTKAPGPCRGAGSGASVPPAAAEPPRPRLPPPPV